MSTPKDKGELFTELEEGLRGVYRVVAILRKMVELSDNDDTPVYDVLVNHLNFSYKRAYRAFCDLHDLVVGPPRLGGGGL
jgi:hypothetical protein